MFLIHRHADNLHFRIIEANHVLLTVFLREGVRWQSSSVVNVQYVSLELPYKKHSMMARFLLRLHRGNKAHLPDLRLEVELPVK